MRRLTKITATATLLLIFIGSLVTSTGSGLAVPDWPLSYGMLFPPMVGGILYEHGHRMAAAAVGLLVVLQAVVVSRCERRRWVRGLAWLAVVVILIQGGLGGLTVLLLLPTPISMTHAVLAQTLFLLLVFLAYTVSREWHARQVAAAAAAPGSRAASAAATALVASVYVQLLLGALMRHTESGLAIPDFPLMGGQVVPRFDDRMLAHVNADRFQLLLEPVSRAQVVIHFLHRLGAAGVGLAVVAANRTIYRSGAFPAARRLLKWINGGTVLQALLGVLTVLTARSPAIASFHVLLGAALLAVALLFLLRCAPLPARGGPVATPPQHHHG